MFSSSQELAQKLHAAKYVVDSVTLEVVFDFRLSRRRVGPGERADGVVQFERPPYKRSSETLFLQMAESGAVDEPALVPIGFGISNGNGGVKP